MYFMPYTERVRVWTLGHAMGCDPEYHITIMPLDLSSKVWAHVGAVISVENF